MNAQDRDQILNQVQLQRRDWVRRVLGGAVGGGLAAATLGAQAAPGAQEATAVRAAGNGVGRGPRIGLALGGGTARGFAHIGVLKSLAQANIKPEVVVGCSAGALVGAFYAAGFTPWQLEEVALRVRDAEVADFASAGKRGMLVGESLYRFVNDILKGTRIESMPTRFAAVATDLRSGELVVLRKGLVAEAVCASCAIPGVFVPREVGGRELVDGGLVSPLPVGTARNLGCDVVIAVDVGAKPHRTSLPGLYEVLLQSFEIMGRALSDQEARSADVVIQPDTSTYASSDFNVRREMIQVGYEASQRVLPELQRRMNAPSRRGRG
jgi:NTE family protein